MATFNFDDGLFPASWTNGEGVQWAPTTELVDSGVFSLASSPNVTNNQTSTCFIIGDFAAGTFDLRYLISSEGNYDFGYVIVDGVAIVNKVSGGGGWQNMAQQTLTAGIHIIQFVFNMDNGSGGGNDSFYIDSVTLPTFTDISDSVDYLNLSNTVFANDATNPYFAAIATGARNTPFIGVNSPSGGTAPSTMSYTSPSDSPAGVMFFLGHSDQQNGEFELFIDSAQVFIDVGAYYSNDSGQLRAPIGHYQTVSAGAHTYEFTSAVSISSRAYMFYEPSMTAAAPSGFTALVNITEAPDTISISAETSNPSAVSITISEQADGVLISASVGGATVAPSVLGSQLTRGVSFDIDMGTAYTAGASTDYVEVWIVGVDGSEVQCTVTANTDGMISATPPTVTGKIEVRPITILAN